MKPETISKLSTRLAVKTPKVEQNLRDIIASLDKFELQEDPDSTQVDILVLEIGENPTAELETIRALLQEGVVGTLFVTSSKTTSDILLPALRTGAKEFFQQPIIASEVIEAFTQVAEKQHQANAATDAEAPSKNGKIISVLGSKGGVGTTTFAVNLATNLQTTEPDKLVALLDMNRLVGEVPLFLDLETDINWEEIGKNINRLDASYLKSAMAHHSSGIYVMPAPNKIQNGSSLPQGFLVQILTAMQAFFDFIVVDAGMYMDEVSFKVFDKSDTVYLISTMSLPCIINVKRLKDSMKMFGGVTNGKVQVVANRFEKKSQISLAEANQMIGSDIATTIPNDYALTMTAINSGKALAEVGKNSKIAQKYAELASTVAGLTKQQKSRWKLFH